MAQLPAGDNSYGQATPLAGTFTGVRLAESHVRFEDERDSRLLGTGSEASASRDMDRGGSTHSCGEDNRDNSLLGDNSTARNAASRDIQRGERRSPAHVRCKDRRDSGLLGRQYGRPGNAAIRDIQRGERRSLAYLRGKDKRDSSLLGEQ
jgi:hypothetical protein